MDSTNNQTQPVKITLQIGSTDTYTSIGKTILEAINNLPIPDHLKTNGFIKAEADGKTAIRQLTIHRLRRIFCTSENIRGYVRTILAKHLGLFLK